MLESNRLEVLMKQFLIILVAILFSAAFAAPIQVSVAMPGGLKIGKNEITAQVQADSSYNGTPVMLVVDPGNSQAVQEVMLGKVGDSSFKGEVELKSLNATPSLTVKVSKPDARYAATQVLPASSSGAEFILEAPRSRNMHPLAFVAAIFVLFGGLGAMALRGEKTAF
jgi:hypothetical protein